MSAKQYTLELLMGVCFAEDGLGGVLKDGQEANGHRSGTTKSSPSHRLGLRSASKGP